MKYAIPTISTVLVLFGAGCLPSSAPQAIVEPPPIAAVAPTLAPAPEPILQGIKVGDDTNSLTVKPEFKPGTEILIDLVVTAKRGFIAIHSDVDGKPGKILATSVLLNAGETRDVPVKMDVQPGARYWAMLHADNGNGVFSATMDLPVKDQNRAVIMISFKGAGGITKEEPAKETAKSAEPEELETVAATIDGFAFAPVTIKVKQGSKIVYTNKDGAAHTVTADGGAFSSPNLKKDESFTLDTAALIPGSYPFHCTIHPSMKGTVVVE